MHLDFELCDLEQNVLTRLDGRKAGGWIELGVNRMRRSFCPLSLDDSARELAKAISTVLRITLKGPEDFSMPLFIGRVVIPDKAADAQKFDLGLYALDPLFHLEKKLIRSAAGSTWNPKTFAGKDQALIMWELLAAFEDHGVAKGSIPTSINRDRTYAPGKEVGEALIEMAEVIGGPDFELEPVIASDGTLCNFNTFYPHQGEDKSDEVVFVFRGAGEDAVSFHEAPGGEEIANRVLVVGAPNNSEGESSPIATHPAHLAEHLGSIEDHEGEFERREQLDDVKEGATLKAHAEGLLAQTAYPTPYFDFTVAPEQYEEETGEGVPPRFGVDYWLGDTIKVEAFLGGDEPEELIGRVIDAKVAERESGQIAVELTCAPEVSTTGITGKALTLNVPEGE